MTRTPCPTSPNPSRLAAVALATLPALLMTVPQAQAQTYPSRQVRLVVPFAAGGSTDMIARLIGSRLTPALGQNVLVDNRPGGGTVIGTEIVARSAPDGHTLLVVPAPFTINPGLRAKLPYDPLNDFTPITLINTTPLVVAVNPSVPARTPAELIALAKARPGVLNFGSSGVGGSNHLAGELFNAMAKVKTVHVPYKGNAPALADLIGGHLDMIYNGLTSAYPLIKSGKVRAIALTSLKRSPVLPDLPTLHESGLAGFEAVAWNGLAGPGNTPRAAVERIAGEVARILADPEFAKRLRAEGSDPVGSSPEEFARFLRAEMAKWKKVIEFAGVKPQ